MTVRETAQEIDVVAADWAARLDRGDLSPEEDQALEAWLSDDPRRIGAFARARAVSLSSERARALGPQFCPDDFLKPQVTEAPTHRYDPMSGRKIARKPDVDRRRFLWGGALAAGFGGLTLAGLGVPSYGKEYLTHLGEVKVIPMADGSVISMNTDSRIRVRYSQGQRLVHLERGEVLFEVAHDAARPFIVKALGTEVLAVGTSFTVRKLGDAGVQVLVREGLVKINRHNQDAVRVGASRRAIVQTTDAAEALPARVEAYPVERELAWREGRIAFEGETLRSAAAEFRRYSETRILIDDPVVANETITGLFQSNDPVGFARAVAASFGLQAEVSEKQVRLYRQAV
ncbi:FecR family protein [Asticcacaulis tiandongensis]|uniref:FecR family protein n=1 Tax=Asticcacaulis tiandongensis TaxID=2565365 RepID=UPI0015E84AFE|nr:FecR domain-containing protein [Asticcacaulis tiandongensis]